MIPTKSDITLMSFDEKLRFRKELQKEISIDRRKKNLRIETFIPALRIDDFLRAKEWAYSKQFIPKNTNWAFAKFAVLNMIDLIQTEIKNDITQNPEFTHIPGNQKVPNAGYEVVYDSNTEPVTDK